MPRRRRELIEHHKELEKIEHRIERAWLKSVEKIQSKLPVGKLATAIEIGARKNAYKLMPQEVVFDSLKPMSKIIGDTLIKGGKLAAKELTRGRRG